MRVIAVIPARLASMRLPQKMLREINGRPLAVWVYQAVRSSPLLEDVIIATDSEEIVEACRKHSCKARMTSSAHRTGSSGLRKKSSAIPSPVGTRMSLPFASAARKHSVLRTITIEFLHQLDLLVNQQLRITDHVNQQEVCDLELEIRFCLG